MSTLAQLRARVRYNLGEPVGQKRFFDASINNHINEGYGQYQTDLMNNGEGDLTTIVNIDLVANQAAYVVPANYVRTRKLERVTTFGTVPLEDYERYQSSNVTISGNSGDWYLPTFRYRDRSIIFEPYPTFSEVGGLIHEYYFLQAALVLDGDSPVAGFVEPWQSMLVLYATIAELEGKEAIGGVADISTFRERLVSMEERFKTTMQGRSQTRQVVEPYGLGYDLTMWPY